MAQLATPSSRPASSGAAARPLERPVQKMLPEAHWDEPTKAVLDKVSRDATTIDRLVDETGLPIEQVLAGLSRLEAGGAIRRLSGYTVQLK
jgi:predicted Rossmann fold nucleotide-binding protein DprA/Smf involved in DNA uptake